MICYIQPNRNEHKPVLNETKKNLQSANQFLNKGIMNLITQHSSATQQLNKPVFIRKFNIQTTTLRKDKVQVPVANATPNRSQI